MPYQKMCEMRQENTVLGEGGNVIKNCLICGKPFEVDDMDRNRSHRKYCGEECAYTAAYERKKRYAQNGKKQMANVKCEICGKIFLTPYIRQVTCGPECKYERSRILSRENDRKRREAIRNGTHPSLRKKAEQNKVEPIHDFNRRAREMGMTYGQYDLYLRMQATRKERAQNGGA